MNRSGFSSNHVCMIKTDMARVIAQALCNADSLPREDNWLVKILMRRERADLLPLYEQAVEVLLLKRGAPHAQALVDFLKETLKK